MSVPPSVNQHGSGSGSGSEATFGPGDVSSAEPEATDKDGEDDLYGFSADLTDGYYQFKSEKLASLFGLGETFRIKLMTYI